MKNIYVKGRDGLSSLPILIKMFQYNKAWLVNNFGFNPNSKSTAALGNMGDKFFDFSVDCAHEFIGTYKNRIDDDPFGYINNILRTSANPTITKSDLEKRYFILECPDFGSQSMTAFYRDFVPQVWYNGKKIWQKYVGIIKYYPRKLAYILIPRDGNKLNTNIKDNIYDSENNEYLYENFTIRAVFKNNIEDIYSIDDTTKYYSLTTEPNAFHEEIAKIELENIDVFTSRDIHEDFDLYFKEEGKSTWRKVLNSRMFYKLELVPDFDDGYTVERQTKSGGTDLTNIDSKIDLNLEDTYDYYKQSYFRDYIDNDANGNKDQEYNRSSSTCYSLFITLSLGKDATPVEVRLVPRSNLYDAMYIQKNEENKFDLADVRKYYPVKYPEDIMIFNKDGEKIADPVNTVFGNNPTGDEYEIIPEYSSVRKYEWKDVTKLTLDSNGISEFLKKNQIYPWATRHPEVLGFNNGLLQPQPEYSLNEGVEILSNRDSLRTEFDDLIIYWNEEEHIDAFVPTSSESNGSNLTQFSQSEDDDNGEYKVLTDENLVTRENDVDEKHTAVFPFNKDNSELAEVLDPNEPVFYLNRDYFFVGAANTNVPSIDYAQFINDINCLEETDYYFKRTTTEESIDEQFDNLSNNIIDMFVNSGKEPPDIYNQESAVNGTVPFNNISEYYLLEFTEDKNKKAAVYLIKEVEDEEQGEISYSDIELAEFVTVFTKTKNNRNRNFGIFVPNGTSYTAGNNERYALYSPNNAILNSFTLKQVSDLAVSGN